MIQTTTGKSRRTEGQKVVVLMEGPLRTSMRVGRIRCAFQALIPEETDGKDLRAYHNADA